MATNDKAPIKDRIAAAKKAQEVVTAASKEARVRTICAWTIAKTMLPKAPAEVQQHMASALLGASTKVLKAALRQTAINAHWTKFAETFEQVHKKDLNDLMSPESELSKEKSAVMSEVKGEAKSAAPKKADDRKDAGPQEGTYDDGKRTEPKDMDAAGSEVRPADSVNKTDGSEKEENSVDNSAMMKESSKKKSACGCGKDGCEKCASAKTACGCGKEGCEKCAKAASSKVADEPMAPEAPAVDAAPAAEAAPEAPAVDAPMDEAPAGDAPAEEAEGLLTEDKKQEVAEQIAEAQQAIQNIEETILEEGEEELDLNKIFSEPDEKVDSLANEGEEMPEMGEGEDFFGPSDEGEMAASMDNGADEMNQMFATDESADSMASLFASAHNAAAVDGMEVVPSSTGEAANHFESELKGDDRDSATDHTDDLWAEIIEDQKPEESGQKRDKADQEPIMSAPKAAAKKTEKPAVQKIKASATPVAPATSLADLLFGGDDN